MTKRLVLVLAIAACAKHGDPADRITALQSRIQALEAKPADVARYFYCGVGIYALGSADPSLHITLCWRKRSMCESYGTDRGCVLVTDAWCPVGATADFDECAFERELCQASSTRQCVQVRP